MSSPRVLQRLVPFADALRESMTDRNVELGDVARALRVRQRELEGWIAGAVEPWPAAVFEMERLLGLAPGQLSRRLGYLPLSAPRSDPTLTDVLERSALLDQDDKVIVLRLVRVLVAKRQMRLWQPVLDAVHPRWRPERPGSMTRIATGSGLGQLKEEWTEVLRGHGATRNTVENYRSAVEQLRQFLVREGRSHRGQAIRGADVEDFLADALLRNSPLTVTSRYRALRVFFTWLVEIGELAVSPMESVRPPNRPSRRRRASEIPSGRG